MKSFTVAAFATAALIGSVAAQTPVCSQADFDKIKTWMVSCDAVTTGTAAKCADRACHTALHRLEEEETKQCWTLFGGDLSAFTKYAAIDAFCHGEGPDPELPVGATAAPPSNSTAAPGPFCTFEDGLRIYEWMFACDSVEGDYAAKCASEACHTALHRLEEEETHECWEFLGLGTHEDFEKYEVIDAFCHGEEHDGDHDHDHEHK